MQITKEVTHLIKRFLTDIIPLSMPELTKFVPK